MDTIVSARPLQERTKDYILTLPHLLNPHTCARLVQRFEDSPHVQQTCTTPGYSFTQVNVSHAWPDVHTLLLPLFAAAARRYAQTTGLADWWPPHDYEAIRMKRYLPGGVDAFPLHLDAADYASARRFLVMFLYLNDVAVGGETAFPQWGLAVKPFAGTMLMFPPFYPYLHEGRAPIEGPKYIVGSYCHFR